MPIVLDQWIDRDLTAAARQGTLAPAFDVGSVVEQAEEVLRAVGTRTPVIVGPPGVGKTAIVHELVRRAHEGIGVALLRDSRVVQISLRSITARFKERSDAAIPTPGVTSVPGIRAAADIRLPTG